VEEDSLARATAMLAVAALIVLSLRMYACDVEAVAEPIDDTRAGAVSVLVPRGADDTVVAAALVELAPGYLDPAAALEHVWAARTATAGTEVDPYLLLGMAYVESRYQPAAISRLECEDSRDRGNLHPGGVTVEASEEAEALRSAVLLRRPPGGRTDLVAGLLGTHR